MGRLMVTVVSAARANKPIPDEHIHWHCPECGERGVITNWGNTVWDLSHEREDLRAVIAGLQQEEPVH